VCMCACGYILRDLHSSGSVCVYACVCVCWCVCVRVCVCVHVGGLSG
jgi:hypothetical protein